MQDIDLIKIKGANQHNLKDVSLNIPKNKLVVFTGISGSGKSSLAFDTIYAEGQRRYVESLSSYARQFLGLMTKPEVESIEGLSPAISIDQKATSHNPRSTVGTVTEIYDYLRLLFARIGHPHCPKCGKEISQQSVQSIVDQMLDSIIDLTQGKSQTRFMILSPIITDRKGAFQSLFANLIKKSHNLVRVDNHVYDLLEEEINLIKTNKHSIDAVIERFTFDKKRLKSASEIKTIKTRLTAAVEASLKLSNGLAVLSQVKDKALSFPNKPTKFSDHLYSERFACPKDNISLPEIEPRIFSFNSPHGACPTCNGLGNQLKVDPDLIIAPEISISEGAIIPYASTMGHDTWFRRTVDALLKYHGHSIKTTFNQIPLDIQQKVLYGDPKVFTVSGSNQKGRITSIQNSFEGFIPNLERRYQETKSEYIRNEIQKYMRKQTCPECNGSRLKKQSLSITILNKNINQVTAWPIAKVLTWMKDLNKSITKQEKQIGSMIIKELITRLTFLTSVGLNYLTLNREAGTLAGGEAQRIRLASQIGTGLTGVLYVLDEPTIGLHQRDNQKLIHTLKHLRDIGNSVIVVEHDQETIEAANWIIDFGPLAGKLGGKVIAQGDLKTIKKTSKSLTGKYLAGKKQVKAIKTSAKKDDMLPKNISIQGCSQHNLKNIDVDFPLNKLICITGVSGSGKSTLIHNTLFNALIKNINNNNSNQQNLQSPGKYTHLYGADNISKVRLITQRPIGRTPRSNPVTYTKAFDHIRNLFAQSQQAQLQGFNSGRFSFNVKGGRCEACRGGGEVKIEMQFLPDVYVKCDVCNGARYNEQTLNIHYKGKNISDILHLTVNEALDFFKHIPQISRKLETLKQVGLGYIELGQPAPQLSGGEAQRIKLAKELSIKSFGHTIYLLDEPTTGLHFADIEKLLSVLKALVNQQNTVIVIEHNLDVIKNSDWIIDLGPEGGDKGGEIVTQGTPKHISKCKKSYTGQFLKKVIY